MSMPNLFLFVMFKYLHITDFAIYLKWILVADKNAVLLQDGLQDGLQENEIFAVIVSTSEQLKRRPERPV